MTSCSLSSSQRIAVIGISGAGKSTFASKLGEETGLPLFHMDQLFWGENWVSIPETEWQNKEKEVLQKQRWIIEGYIDEKGASRLGAADRIIYLDFSGIRCALNGLKRWWRYRKTKRPELPEGCIESLDFGYIWAILLRKERRDIEALIGRLDVNTKLDRIKTSADLDKYFKE